MTNYITNFSFMKILKLYNQLYDNYSLYPLITKLRPITPLYDQYITQKQPTSRGPTYVHPSLPSPLTIQPNTPNHMTNQGLLTISLDCFGNITAYN